ncbi:MAG TPA: c-type cytochrome [Burkholderiaceae bacterium]|nr:c-type cytochrome [Burkholderiaceae bacterium]
MTTNRKFMCGLAAVAAALLALRATAQTTTPPEGRLLASNCFQCHATDGRGGFEEINGKSSTEIYSKLKEMQRKQPGSEDVGIMTPHAKGYTDAQLLKISLYLSTVR